VAGSDGGTDTVRGPVIHIRIQYNTSASVDTINEKTSGHGILLDLKVLAKDGYIRLDEITAPSAPSAGYGLIYLNSSDGHAYLKTSSATFDLTEGTGGGGSEVGDSVWMLGDTITFPFGFGAGNPNDTATCRNGAFMGGWYNEQDSLMSCKVIGNCKGSGADVYVKILYDVNKWDATPTTVWSGTITTAGGQVTSTTFTTKKIPPNVHVWAEVDAYTEQATLLTLDYLFSKKRAQ